MKKSFFKRAVASACAVPVALTQCLIIPGTAAEETQAAATTVTVDDLLYINPDVEISPVITENGRDIQRSQWNLTLKNALTNAFAKTGGNALKLDPTAVCNAIVANSGAYEEVVAALLLKVSENDITCAVDANGVVTVNAAISDVVDVFTEGGSKTIGGALRDFAAEYGAADLVDVDFSSVKASGSLKITVDGSNLENSTTIPVSYEFTAEDGKVYSIAGVLDYALEKFDAIKNVAYNAVDSIAGLSDSDKADAYKEIDDSVAIYENYINRAIRGINKYTADSFSVERKFETAEDAFAYIQDVATNRKLPLASLLPSSATDAISKPTIASAYDSIMSQVNTLFAVDIPADQFAATVDEMYDITLNVADGNAVVVACLPDAENPQVAEAVKELGKELVSSYKEITVTVDLDVINNTTGSVDLDLVRVLELTDVQTTTTTTTTSTTTTTTTSTSDSDVTTTTTSTSATGSDTTTTTSTSATGSDTTTTTSTSATGSDTTTSTSTSTTTSTVVTTSTLVSTSVSASTEIGFYLSYMDEFSLDQVGDVVIIEEYLVDTLNEDGTLGEPATKTVEIPVDVNFGSQTPKNTFIEGNDKFDYQVQLYMLDDDFNNVPLEGLTVTCYIGKKGDANLDNAVDAVDATAILVYYSYNSMNVDRQLSQEDEILDNFAAFLADVDADETVGDFWKCKDIAEKAIDPNDATNVLKAYSSISLGVTEDKALWDQVLNRA